MKYLTELKKLNLPKDKYAISGSGPLAIRNLRENKDLDIIVSDKLWHKLSKKYRYCSKYKDGIILSKHISAWRMRGRYGNFKLTFKDREIIDGFPFIKLEKTIKWKKKRNLLKDKKDIKLIENYLKNLCKNK